MKKNLACVNIYLCSILLSFFVTKYNYLPPIKFLNHCNNSINTKTWICNFKTWSYKRRTI